MKRIIIILCDTLRAKSLPHYGSKRNTLPRLSPVIEKDFIVYKKAYAPAPWTIPSHLSLFTGLYPLQVMEDKKSFYLNESFITLADMFKESGYRTIAFSSNALISKKFGFDKGFDRFFQMWLPNPEDDDAMLDLKAKNDIERLGKILLMMVIEKDKQRLFRGIRQKLYKRFKNDIFKDASFATEKTFKILMNDVIENRDRKSFYFLNLMQTHEKHNPPPCTRNIFVKDDIKHERYYKDKKFADHYAVERFSEELLRYLELLYDEEILFLDIVISDFINFLEENKLYDETTIIITSDHGEQFGEHGHYTRTFSVYEPVIRIPLYIKWAGKSDNSSRVRNGLVMLQDLYSTFLNILNHWQQCPDSSIDLNSSYKRSWIVSQFPDMSHDIMACRQKRQSFSIKELGLENEGLTAFVFDNETKIIENGFNIKCFDLVNDPDEEKPLSITSEQIKQMEEIKRLCI
ncbi:MAG: sulfatase [Candidatus Nitrosotenuis sp.]